MNEQAAKEWVIKAWHNLSGAIIFFDSDEKKLLINITEYHIEESYPAFDRKMPPKEEIKEVLDFTEELFDKVCKLLKIDKTEIIK